MAARCYNPAALRRLGGVSRAAGGRRAGPRLCACTPPGARRRCAQARAPLALALLGAALAVTGLGAPQRALAAQPALPDSLDAAHAETTPEGVIRAWDGATLTITSMVDGGTVRVEAENAEYNTHTGYAELSGGVASRWWSTASASTATASATTR